MKQAGKKGSKAPARRSQGFRAVVFTDTSQSEDSDVVVSSKKIDAGVFSNPDEAWSAAKAKCIEVSGIGCTIEELSPTPLLPDVQAGRTVKDAHRLILSLKDWGRSLEDESDAQVLFFALTALEKTLVSGSTEISEALLNITSAASTLTRSQGPEDVMQALESIRVGSGYLHRWQDRGGRLSAGK